jgi:glycerophosphoryl diester phosphodiesterase
MVPAVHAQDVVEAPPSFDLQGHRGARGLLPENSVPGFIRALEIGVTTLEMDVVVAGDSTIVVSHEPWMLHEICSLPDGTSISAEEEQSHRILDLVYEEVGRFDCGSRGHERFPGQTPVSASKPRLRDVVRAAEDYAVQQRLSRPLHNIETKIQPGWEVHLVPDALSFTRLLSEELDELGVKDRTVIQSFDPRTLRAARELDPEWQTALLVAGEIDEGLDQNLRLLGFVPDIYSPDYALVDSTLLAQAHAHGMRVIPWTVNDAEDMKRLIDLGVDGLITDYPDLGSDLVVEILGDQWKAAGTVRSTRDD